ncbi:hypothetical protein I79_004730 [Cricetulus griseus]|uniref:Uncharacterized protein n=1 Tax=Cricetulus griseus TaxID=10029 RepID=G3H3B5_CRIGR|nr:hypothetical protein I79_004730 [Cricetulus griseus]
MAIRRLKLCCGEKRYKHSEALKSCAYWDWWSQDGNYVLLSCGNNTSFDYESVGQREVEENRHEE